MPLSSQKEMAVNLTPEAMEKQSCAMGVQVFEIGLFDPNAAKLEAREDIALAITNNAIAAD
jgi:hypothetical protein